MRLLEMVKAAARGSFSGLTHSLFWKLLVAFLLLSVVPVGLLGIGVANQIANVRALADRTSHTYESRAEAVAAKVSALLRGCEADLRELARIPRTDQAYASFVNQHKRNVLVRAGTNESIVEERVDVPLYKEVSFVDAAGLEQVLVIRGQPTPKEQHRNVSDPGQTTYRSEEYFAEATKLKSNQIYVSHLTGFHVNKFDALGLEKLIANLRDKNADQKQIYRYMAFEMLRAAGEMEFVNSFQEGARSILVYRPPGDKARILVEVPPRLNPEELRVAELELRTYLKQLAPEDVVEGAGYDGVVRFATPVDAPDGRREGIVVLALDHIHLTQLTQHIKAMEENATVFAGYRDADYTFLFDDEGWVITHPKAWNIRGVDRNGRPVPPYTNKSKLSEVLVGHTAVNLLTLDWKLGEGYQDLVKESRSGRTGIITRNNLAGVLCTRVYSPIFYDTGSYAQYGIFGGVMMGTRVDKFIELMRQMNGRIASRTVQLRQVFVWVLLGMLLVVALLSVIMARGLVRPILVLGQAAQRIGGGDLNAPIPALGRDEIGELALSFGEMTKSLKTTIEELERKNTDLKEAQQKLLLAEREKRRELQREVTELQKEIARASFASIIAVSPQMLTIQEEIVRVAGSSATVLIFGENGTGKELIAEAIHRNSNRRDKKFLKVNCAAFNDNLLESELFGHLKGSYTGASSSRKGLFESADGGTILLDEIGDMSLAMQTKLLRTLQEGEVVPVGGNQVVKVDVRILAATNKDLHQMMRESRFREDLFHRINVISIRIPPLRERKEDILPLAAFFLETVCNREGRPLLAIDSQAERFLTEYRWPGNVRELENAIERAVIRSRASVLRVDDFQLSVEKRDLPCVTEGAKQGMTLEEVEKAYILSVLEKHGGNKKATAEELGIGYNTLWRKLKLYNKV